MLFNQKKTAEVASIKKENVSLLTMYNNAPSGKMEFDDFALYAIERFSSRKLYHAQIIRISPLVFLI